MTFPNATQTRTVGSNYPFVPLPPSFPNLVSSQNSFPLVMASIPILILTDSHKVYWGWTNQYDIAILFVRAGHGKRLDYSRLQYGKS